MFLVLPHIIIDQQNVNIRVYANVVLWGRFFGLNKAPQKTQKGVCVFFVGDHIFVGTDAVVPTFCDTPN
jgi:hypothetical protein